MFTFGFMLFGGKTKFSTLGSRVGVALSTEVTSRKCYIPESGDYSIVDGTIALNDGAFGAGPVTATLGDYIRARVTSSASYETEVTVTVSGPSSWESIFSVTTMVDATTYLVDGGDFLVDGADSITDGA